MSLKIIRRKDTGNLQINGTVAGQRIRQAAQGQSIALAREEATALEARLLREQFHGRPKGRADRPFAEIAEAYLNFQERHPAQVERIENIVFAMGNVMASEVDQEFVDNLRLKVIKKKNPAPATVRSQLFTPIRAILIFGARRKWCERPDFQLPAPRKGRTVYVLPSEARRLVETAAPHLRPLLIFMYGVGSRVAETLALTWRDIDLVGARATIVQKGSRIRHAHLPPAVVAALAALPHREGAVFRWYLPNGRAGEYAKKEKGAGQIKVAWDSAIRRAGLSGRGLTPHSTRHTFASWHYALHRDLLKLKLDGGWETLAMVERYAHLMPQGFEHEIDAFWGYSGTDLARSWPGQRVGN
jgi:integrase